PVVRTQLSTLNHRDVDGSAVVLTATSAKRPRLGDRRILTSGTDPRGKQRLGPLEVVRYSDVDEESRANQPIDPAVETPGKNLPLQRDGCACWQVADDLLSKQINAGVDQTGAGAYTLFDERGHAAILVERHTPIASDIGDRLQHEHQIGIFSPEELQHW